MGSAAPFNMYCSSGRGRGWDSKAKRISYRGNIYNSVAHLSRALGISASFCGLCVRKGKPIGGHIASFICRGKNDKDSKINDTEIND